MFLFRRFLVIILFLFVSSSIFAQDISNPRSVITPENARDLTELFQLNHSLTSLPNLQWSSDGRWMVASGLGGIYLYDLDSGLSQQIDTTALLLQGGATFSPDGHLLATAGDGYIVIWDMLSGEQVDVLITPYTVAEMQFSPDGMILAVTANGQVPSQSVIDVSTVYLWDIATGEQYGSVGYYDLITRADVALPFAFSADGDSLLTLRNDVVAQWDYRQPENTRPNGLMSREDLLAFLQDNYVYAPIDAQSYAWIAYQSEDGLWALWLMADNGDALFTTQDGDVIEVVPNESGVDFDEEGIPQMINGYTRLDQSGLIPALSTLDDLVFETFDDSVMIVNRDSASAVTPRYGYNAERNIITDRFLNLGFEGIEQSGVGRYVSSFDDILLQRYYIVDATALEPATLYTLDGDYDMRFTANAKLLIVRNRDDVAMLQLIDLTTGEISFELALSSWDGQFEGVAINPDESLLVYGFYDEQTDLRGHNIIDMQTENGITSLPFSGEGVTFNFDGSLLAFRSLDSPLSFWGIRP